MNINKISLVIVVVGQRVFTESVTDQINPQQDYFINPREDVTEKIYLRAQRHNSNPFWQDNYFFLLCISLSHLGCQQ